MLARVECSRTLLDIFARYEEFLDQGRLAYKIAGSLLSLFLHLVSTGEVSFSLGTAVVAVLTPRKTFLVQGRSLFVSCGGVQIVRDFCHSSKASETKKWDRLLCRGSAVISRCCEKMRLPVKSEVSPLRFVIPEGTEEDKKRNGKVIALW